MNIVLLPSAQRDLRNILDHLEFASQSPSIRRRFLSSVEETCLMMARHPQIGQKEAALGELHPDGFALRRFVVRRFPKYLIFYRAGSTSIAVVRILHGARSPVLRTVEPS